MMRFSRFAKMKNGNEMNFAIDGFNNIVALERKYGVPTGTTELINATTVISNAGQKL